MYWKKSVNIIMVTFLHDRENSVNMELEKKKDKEGASSIPVSFPLYFLCSCKKSESVISILY